jgi:predicted MFS family arabinose efflux permease
MIRALGDHLRNPELLCALAIGFCILFAFIGAFTYVNFVLARPPIGLGMMAIGFVYFVFLPSLVTTPAAGGFVRRFGARMTIWGGLAVALAGLPLLITPSLAPVVAGLTLVGVGTFFAQAVTTGFVGRVAMTNRGAASGLYLAGYFSGGLVGSAVLGQIFDRFGWSACVIGVGLALAVSVVLATHIRSETDIAGCPVEANQPSPASDPRISTASATKSPSLLPSLQGMSAVSTGENGTTAAGATDAASWRRAEVPQPRL